MAAGTALDAMAITTAEDAAAQEFARVVQKHRPQIFRFLLASTRDVDLAETLTQECFLKAHRNWASFRGDAHRNQSPERSLAQPAHAVLADNAHQWC
jgi:RNA polymerase sigma-70 factor (ECF subfamily)